MSVLMLLVIFLCALIAVWSWLRHPNAPPQYPGALPIIGHSLKIIGDRKHLWNFVRSLQMWSLEKGGVSEIWFANHSVYMVSDPEASLLISNSCLKKSYIYDFAKDYLKNGLVTAEVSTWRPHRKLLSPSFNQQVLNTYDDVMNEQARSLVSQLASKVGQGPFDARKFFIDYTLSTVTRTSLGLNAQDQTKISPDYADGIGELFNLYCDRFQKVWLHLSYFFDRSSMKRRQTRLIEKLENITDPIIHKRKAELKANKYTNMYDASAPGKFKPVLDQMLQLAEEKYAFTDDDIKEHLNTFVIAAYDTTSTALTLILLIIGSDLDLQERIFNELQAVLGHKDDITKPDLPKLKFLEAVINESMRLHPPIPLIGRKIEKDINLNNYTLRTGNTCLIGVYSLLRHPMWGPDADQFRPERWLNSATLPDHPILNAAFGIGRRNCIGKTYSMMVMKMALAQILRRYQVTGDINKVVSEFDVILKPVEGHHVALTLRS